MIRALGHVIRISNDIFKGSGQVIRVSGLLIKASGQVTRAYGHVIRVSGHVIGVSGHVIRVSSHVIYIAIRVGGHGSQVLEARARLRSLVSPIVEKIVSGRGTSEGTGQDHAGSAEGFFLNHINETLLKHENRHVTPSELISSV